MLVLVLVLVLALALAIALALVVAPGLVVVLRLVPALVLVLVLVLMPRRVPCIAGKLVSCLISGCVYGTAFIECRGGAACACIDGTSWLTAPANANTTNTQPLCVSDAC